TNMGVNVSDLEMAMDKEVEKVQNELISETEFQKLRNQVESDYVTSNSRVAGIAESLATYYMFFGDANLINNELDRYLAVTREDIQAAAKKYMVPSNRVVLYYLPKSLDTKS
ncbi:MAG TPA: insulinase family protein, partial [Saprospiraceae bacterium]|nr:insulinase family protein [Saprospiraceae bacterium]